MRSRPRADLEQGDGEHGDDDEAEHDAQQEQEILSFHCCLRTRP